MWGAQFESVVTIVDNRLVIILKARQLGMTWLVLGYVLWLMLFRPAATALLFSRRDDEATHLLDRLRGMYKRIQGVEIPTETYGMPASLPVAKKVEIDNTHIWQLSNGSIAYGFPTTAGDSYTATIAVVDEADLIPDLDALMNAVKPTIDGGGHMILLSRSNKKEPNSPFKRMFVAAHKGLSPWKSIFLPWYVRPGRTQAWYADQKRDILSRTGSLDDLYQQYPATIEEAIQPPTQDKRIPPEWLVAVYEETPPLPVDDPLLADAPAINGIEIFVPPVEGRRYIIGGDPAEGNPNSDDSSMTVMDAETGEEVAVLAQKEEPNVFATNVATMSEYYNNAPALIERNNHGHAVLGWLSESSSVEILMGWDGKPGWLNNARGKSDMWTKAAEGLRDQTLKIHSQDTYIQVSSIEGATLRAPSSMHDDRATSFALCAAGKEQVSFWALGGIHV